VWSVASSSTSPASRDHRNPELRRYGPIASVERSGLAVRLAGGQVRRPTHAAVPVLADLHQVRTAAAAHQDGEVEGIAVRALVELAVPPVYDAALLEIVNCGWERRRCDHWWMLAENRGAR
jgi:hypothetical protein